MSHGRIDAKVIAQNSVELALNVSCWIRIVGPLRIHEAVACSAKHKSSIRKLLPVIVSPTRIYRSRKANVCKRSGSEHLQPRRSNTAGQLWKDLLHPTVDTYNHVRASHAS